MRFDYDLYDQADAEQTLAQYVRQAWPVIEPQTPYLHNWHIDCLCEHLTACSKGWITRLIINVPPRTGKSRLASILWPTWEWGPGGAPHERWVFATWDGDLASDQSSARRFIMSSDWYRARWGDRVDFARDENRKLHYTNTARGTMFSTTMGSGSLGHGGNRIVLDDPHNTKVVESDIQRKEVLDTFDQDFSRRLNDKEKGVIVLIMQRLHHLDMTAHFLEIYPNAVHLKLEAEAEERKFVDLRPRRPQESDEQFDAAPKRLREEGELLWPEREGPVQIVEAKLVLGALGYAGQYLQRPSPKTGAIFKPDLYRYYKILPPLRRLIGSWDTAAKKGQDNDYSAYTLWGQGARESGSQLFLLHLFQQKMMIPELKRRVLTLYQMGSPLTYLDGGPVPCNLKVPDLILIEDSSAGTFVLQELAAPDWDAVLEKGQDLDPFVPVTPVKVGTDKIARANASTPMLEAGFAQLPDPSVFHVPWLDGLLNSMRSFPVGEHDDDIDSLTQALNYLRANDEPAIIEYYRRQAEKLKWEQDKEQGRTQPPTPAEIAQDKEDEEITNEAAELIKIYESGG